MSLTCTLAASNSNHYEGEYKNLSIGDYLREDYVNTLKAELSASKAAENTKCKEGIQDSDYLAYCNCRMLIINKKTSEKAYLYVSDFNDAAGDTVIYSDGKIAEQSAVYGNEKINVVDNNSVPVHFAIINSRELYYGRKGFEPFKYIFVDGAIKYVTNIIFCGNYIDTMGRTYEFKNNGTAYWLNDNYNYQTSFIEDMVYLWKENHFEAAKKYYYNRSEKNLDIYSDNLKKNLVVSLTKID